MAEYITMKQVPNGTVTAKDDRIVYDANLADCGIIYGCEISYIGNNMIHINAGYGIIKGGLFEIEDHTEYVEYARTGSVKGQIYLRLDLAADDKLVIVKETNNNLHPMVKDDNANFTNGVYEMQLCTFTATPTTLNDVTQSFSVVNMGVLDSLEEIRANTVGGQKAGALAVKQLSNLLGGMQFRVNNNKPEWKGAGADTWFPFNSDRNFTLVVRVTVSIRVYNDYRWHETSSSSNITYKRVNGKITQTGTMPTITGGGGNEYLKPGVSTEPASASTSMSFVSFTWND